MRSSATAVARIPASSPCSTGRTIRSRRGSQSWSTNGLYFTSWTTLQIQARNFSSSSKSGTHVVDAETV